MDKRITGAAALIVLIIGTGVAQAGKPKAAEAMKVAKAWVAAVDEGKVEAAAALTAFPLWVVAEPLDGERDPCRKTVTDPAKLGEAIECLESYIEGSGVWKAWSKKMADGLVEPLLAPRKKLDKLAKTSAVVVQYRECAGVEGWSIVVVSDTKDGPRVTGFVEGAAYCGE